VDSYQSVTGNQDADVLLIDLGQMDHKAFDLTVKLSDLFNDPKTSNLHNIIIDGGGEDHVNLGLESDVSWAKSDSVKLSDGKNYTHYHGSIHGNECDVFISDQLKSTSFVEA